MCQYSLPLDTGRGLTSRSMYTRHSTPESVDLVRLGAELQAAAAATARQDALAWAWAIGCLLPTLLMGAGLLVGYTYYTYLGRRSRRDADLDMFALPPRPRAPRRNGRGANRAAAAGHPAPDDDDQAPALDSADVMRLQGLPTMAAAPMPPSGVVFTTTTLRRRGGAGGAEAVGEVARAPAMHDGAQAEVHVVS